MEFILFKEYDHPLNAVRALEAYEWEQSDRFKTILAYLENPDSVRMPVKLRPQKYCGKESEAVRDELVNLGFENVEMQRTTETTEKAKAGCVVSVMIDESADCDDDYYLQSSTIIITYYEPKTQDEIAYEHPGEICMSNNSKFFIGKHYDYVVNSLRDIGFDNIEVKEMAIPKIGFLTKPDMVAKIIVNGVDGFELNSWHKPEEKILIYYYVKV